jgi:hypothetical protein
MQDETPRPQHRDPWRDNLPNCHVHSDAPHFHEQLKSMLAGEVEILEPGTTALARPCWSTAGWMRAN